MSTLPTAPDEGALWQAKERAAEEYDAQRSQLDALEQELHRRFATFRVPVDSPAWQDLVGGEGEEEGDAVPAFTSRR
jgi:hypothetical protein